MSGLDHLLDSQRMVSKHWTVYGHLKRLEIDILPAFLNTFAHLSFLPVYLGL